MSGSEPILGKELLAFCHYLFSAISSFQVSQSFLGDSEGIKRASLWCFTFYISP
jgi:hypothetical protein